MLEPMSARHRPAGGDEHYRCSRLCASASASIVVNHDCGDPPTVGTSQADHGRPRRRPRPSAPDWFPIVEHLGERSRPAFGRGRAAVRYCSRANVGSDGRPRGESVADLAVRKALGRHGGHWCAACSSIVLLVLSSVSLAFIAAQPVLTDGVPPTNCSRCQTPAIDLQVSWQPASRAASVARARLAGDRRDPRGRASRRVSLRPQRHAR
jgi:hypothetical protein